MADINDLISKSAAVIGTRPVSTTVQSARASGVTSLICADLTGWPTDTPVHFVTYQLDAQGEIVDGSQADFKGLVSDSTINNLICTGGTDNGNISGDIVEMLPTAAYGLELALALLATLNGDGTLKVSAVTEAKIAAGAVTSTKISPSANLIGSVKRTTNPPDTTSSADVAVAGMSVNVSVPSGGRKVKVEAYIGAVLNDDSSGATAISIWRGAVGSGTKEQEASFTQPSASERSPIYIVTPALELPAGTYTFSLGWRTSGSGKSTMVTAEDRPMFIEARLV